MARSGLNHYLIDYVPGEHRLLKRGRRHSRKNTQPCDVGRWALAYTDDSRRDTPREPETQGSNHEPWGIMDRRKDDIPMMNNVYDLEQRMRSEVTHRTAGAQRRNLSRRVAIRKAPVLDTRFVLRFGRLVIIWA